MVFFWLDHAADLDGPTPITNKHFLRAITQSTDPRFNEHSVFHDQMGSLIESICRRVICRGS